MCGVLTDREGEALVRLARAAIEEVLRRNEALATARAAVDLTGGLLVARAVFVTLERVEDGRRALRGCIGSTEPLAPAHEAVVDAAVQAAFHDPRFEPLSLDEYPAVTVSVSALTPPRAVAVESIVPGEDGVILDHRSGRAVFLPEVALELRWSREELLLQLCRKAGLSAGSWREGTLLVFRSQKFGGW